MLPETLSESVVEKSKIVSIYEDNTWHSTKSTQNRTLILFQLTMITIMQYRHLAILVFTMEWKKGITKTACSLDLDYYFFSLVTIYEVGTKVLSVWSFNLKILQS